MNLKTALYLFILIFTLSPVLGQEESALDKEKTKKNIFELLDDRNPSEIIIEAELELLWKNKKSDLILLGTMSFEDVNGKHYRLPVEIEARGKTRRMKCSVPPLKITIDKKALKAADIKNYPKLKTVLPCHEDSISQDKFYRERVVYKMYERVSDYAFQTQDAILKFVHQKDTTHILPAFFIESDKSFRKRKEMEENEDFNIQWSQLEEKHAELVALFQYMISNSDWKVDHKHNLRFFYTAKNTPLYLIPYDFDCSSMVDAPHAMPNPDYYQKSIHDRIYMGQTHNHTDELVTHFVNKKDALCATINDDPYLQASSKEEMLHILEEFYHIINDKSLRKKAIRTFVAP